jgi:hypothetical protein
VARTNLPLTDLVPNGGIAQPTGTVVDQVNGMNVQLLSEAIPAAGSAQHLVIQVTNSAAGAHNIIIRAGVNPPAMRAGIGDLNVSVAAAGTQMVGPLEPGRFVQTDGSVNVDFASGFTGTINAYLIPRTF